MYKVPLFNLAEQHKPFKSSILGEVTQILDNTQFTHGQRTEQFEKTFAKLCQTKYALGTRSGTSALIVALKTLQLQPDDEVITTPCTFSASADTIVLAGGKPVFVDVDPITGNIDPQQIVKKITKKTKAVLIVHLYGVPCDMSSIVDICEIHNLVLIEDASHAHGSMYKNKPVGSFGQFGCFSLYPSKTLGCMGNAGIVTTNSLELLKKLTMYANHGIKTPETKYTHHVHGYNELIDNIQSAVLLLKLKKLKKWIARKKQIAEYYNQVFQQFDHPGMMWSKEVEPSLYVYAVQLKDRKKFQAYCESKGVQTGIYYPTPLHLQPSMKWLGYKKGDLPNAEKFFSQTISLPLFPELTDGQVKYVGKVIASGLSVVKK